MLPRTETECNTARGLSRGHRVVESGILEVTVSELRPGRGIEDHLLLSSHGRVEAPRRWLLEWLPKWNTNTVRWFVGEVESPAEGKGGEHPGQTDDFIYHSEWATAVCSVEPVDEVKFSGKPAVV